VSGRSAGTSGPSRARGRGRCSSRGWLPLRLRFLHDELPWFADVGGTPFLVVPYSKVYNDVRYLLKPTYGTPRHFFELLRAGVDYLCEETARGETPKMMTIGIHDAGPGKPGRTSALRDFLEYVLGRSDVRLMRRLDIARWVAREPRELAGRQLGRRRPLTLPTGDKALRIRGEARDI